MFNNTDFFGILLTTIMGLGWGSFATMAIYRIPLGMPWIGDKPRCFMCKHELNIIDYFSIVSYFIWKGTCRYCNGKYECNISYFLTELLITLGFALCYMKYGFGDLFVILTLMVVTSTILGIIDANHKRIPGKILIATFIVGLVYRMFIDKTFYGALYGGMTGAVIGLAIRHIYFLLKGQKEIGADYQKWQPEDRFAGPGFDYVKMLAIIGIFLPIVPFGAYLITIGAICLAWSIISKRTLRIGTIMATGLVIYVIYPETTQLLIGF